MSVPADRLNLRTATKAKIKRASAQARAEMNRLDRDALADLQRLYRQAASNLQADIQAYAGSDGNIRLEVLQDMLRQVSTRLQQLSQARDGLLEGAMVNAAQLGAQPFTADAASLSGSLNQIANDALQTVRSFVANDGLQLSDRIWRNDRHARDVVTSAIESAVIQGHSASRAANDLLAQGRPVPADIAGKIDLARADRIAGDAGRALMTGTGSPRDNAMRLFRTEINRAHGEAYQATAFAHPDVIGTRFLLSPRHPEPDICDMHASVNRYGLGKGVYPKGKNPWPAHPNTISFVEVVFADEVSTADRQGKEDRISWLKKQPPSVQEAVLVSRKKRAALQRGLLKEGQIGTPWQVLKRRYSAQGIDTDQLVPAPKPGLPGGTGKAGGRDPVEVRTDALRYVLERGEATGFEHALVYDVRSGTQFVQKTTRSRNSVSFTRQELAVFADRRNRLDLVHNHPSGSSLSLADIRMGTLPGIERVTAYGHDGSLYSARSLATADALTDAARAVDRRLRRHIQPLFDNGTLSGSQAGALHQHLHNLALDRAGLIEYSTERIDGLLRATLDLMRPDDISAILEIITENLGSTP